MVEPTVIPRSEHSISRRDVDPDALKVLYRLKEAGFIACLVGGSVRDLLLGRRPKDFDIGTSAHPYQVKRLFRNCWVIGRRFRLVHVKFGQKIIEVATFRRHVPPAEAIEDSRRRPTTPRARMPRTDAQRDSPRAISLIRRDNTFGTPEEDAFRRDFTINALFYDIATFSIIDYVGGLRDLHERVIRAIGDPDERFREDPVRMLRAVAFAERLGFALDPPVEEAIRRNRARDRAQLARAADRGVLQDTADRRERAVFRTAARLGLLEAITPDLQRAAAAATPRGSRSSGSTRTAGGSRRRPTRSRTRCCSGACWCAAGFSLDDGHSAARPRSVAGHAPGGAARHRAPLPGARAPAAPARPERLGAVGARADGARRVRRRAGLAGDSR